MTEETNTASRRVLLRGAVAGAVGMAGAAAMGACGSGGSRRAGAPPELKGKVIAQTGDIPVQGGKVFREWRVVITQPTAGQFRAFSAACPHLGCVVGDVARNVIVCPCHSSEFDATSGKVLSGPSPAPLAEYPIQVQGSSIKIV